MRELIAVTAWYVWWLRRCQSHDEQVPPVFKCVTSIRAITANAIKAKPQGNLTMVNKWVRPRGRFIKVNVDAAFLAQEDIGASAAVLRNDQGLFIAAGATFIPHVGSASMAEALALLHGLKLAVNMGFTMVEVGSNSLEVIQYCSGAERIWNDATAIYAEIISVAGGIGTVEYSHCRREINKVAHDTARFCIESRTDCNWVDEPPSFLLQPLLDDVTLL
jgi:ribonuclease HI